VSPGLGSALRTAAAHELAGWASGGIGLPAGVLRVVLVDIDGVITPGEGQPADLGVFARLQDANAAARSDPLAPAMALCTGRQAPYVELMTQLTGTFLPSIFEHGAGLFVPGAFRYLFHPSLPADLGARLHEVRKALRTELIEPGHAFIQPGKEATMTLYPLAGHTVQEIAAAAREVVERLGGFTVAPNVRGVEVRPGGIDKAAGVGWLANELGVPLDQFAGVGDSDPDLDFLRLVAWAAAPANATPAVRETVHHVASLPFGQGLLEILDRIVARNRELAVPGVADRRGSRR